MTDHEEMNVDDKQERQANVNVFPLNSEAIVFDNYVQTNVDFMIYTSNSYLPTNLFARLLPIKDVW